MIIAMSPDFLGLSWQITTNVVTWNHRKQPLPLLGSEVWSQQGSAASAAVSRGEFFLAQSVPDGCQLSLGCGCIILASGLPTFSLCLLCLSYKEPLSSLTPGPTSVGSWPDCASESPSITPGSPCTYWEFSWFRMSFSGPSSEWYLTHPRRGLALLVFQAHRRKFTECTQQTMGSFGEQHLLNSDHRNLKRRSTLSGLPSLIKVHRIIQSVVSQKKKHQYSILTHIYGI